MFDEPGLRHGHQAMRTSFTIFIPTDNPTKFVGIAEECAAEITDIELSISPYQEGSDIHRLNAASGTGEWIRIGWPTVSLLRLCVFLMDATECAFNPFDGRRTMLVPGKVIDSQTKALLLGTYTSDEEDDSPIEFAEDSPHCRLSSGQLVDLGAIGKGWALDKCAGLLRDAGIERAFLNAGGSSMIAIGTDWPLTIAGTNEHYVLSNQSISVSRLVHPDAGGTHIVSSGSHDVHEKVIASVIGESCAITDALSTAAIASASRDDMQVQGYKIRVIKLADIN